MSKAPTTAQQLKAGPLASNPPEPLKFIRLPKLCETVGYKQSYIWMLISRGDFPKPVKLSPRCSVWIESEIQAWMAAKIAAARPEPSK